MERCAGRPTKGAVPAPDLRRALVLAADIGSHVPYRSLVEIDYQFDLRGLSYGQISRLFALEDATHIAAGASPAVRLAVAMRTPRIVDTELI
jgi:hypothetical protein